MPEGVTSGLVEVRVDGAVSNGVEFSFEGTATRGDDYTMVETVTIEAGSKRERPQLTVIDDLIYEGAETILIEASAEGYVTDTCLIQLADNDPETGVTVSPSSLSITEGESGQYQVALISQPTASVTITLISSNGDVQVPASLTIAPGDWRTPKTVTVQVVHDEDDDDEPAPSPMQPLAATENMMGLTSPPSRSGGRRRRSGVTVTPTRLSIREGQSKSYQVRLKTRPSVSVTISMGSSNGDVGVPSTPLIFTTSTGVSGGWDQFRSVTVRLPTMTTPPTRAAPSPMNVPQDPNYHGTSRHLRCLGPVTDDDPEEPENQPPVPVGTPTKRSRRGAEANRPFLLQRPDGDDLTYSAISSNANLEVSVTGSTLTIRGFRKGQRR